VFSLTSAPAGQAAAAHDAVTSAEQHSKDAVLRRRQPDLLAAKNQGMGARVQVRDDRPGRGG